MLPALSKVRSVLSSTIEVETRGPFGPERRIRLERMGYLYLTASIAQSSWLYLIAQNWNTAKEWMSFPVIGWAMAAIWLGMIWCIPHLFYLGCRLIGYGRDSNARIVQTPEDKRKMRTVALLLALGILLDLAMVWTIYDLPDKGAIIFMSAMMGGRVLQANMEAILQYHGH